MLTTGRLHALVSILLYSSGTLCAVSLPAINTTDSVTFDAPDINDNGIDHQDPLPCTAGYGVREATNDIVDLEDSGGCNFLKGEVPFVDKSCAKLLEQGPCEEGEWLVIDNDDDLLKCKKKECPDGHVKYKNACVDVDNLTLCKPTFELIINEHGEGECECPPGNLYHPPTDKCYVPYTRGPCRYGYIIKMRITDNVGFGNCENNPCPREKMTPLDHRCLPINNLFFSKCYTIGKHHPCKDGSFLLIEPSLAKPFCIAQRPNSIVPRVVKRAAPCQVSYTRSCVRECEGPKSYAFRGSCDTNYAYFYNYGRPICLKGKCRKTSL